MTKKISIGTTVNLKASDVFNYMPSSSLSPSSSSSSAASSSTNNNDTNTDTTSLKPQPVPDMVPPGQYQPTAPTHPVQPPPKQIMNIASTYAIENDSFRFGFNSDQPRYAPKGVEPVRVKQKLTIKEASFSAVTTFKLTNKSLALHDQFGSESLKKSFPVQINSLKIKPKLEALNNREKPVSKHRDVSSASSQNLKLMYGKHIDELTSDLIANLSKDMKKKEFEETVVAVAGEEEEEEEEEVDYEDARGEYSEYFEIVRSSNKPETENIDKLINDIKLIKRDRSALSMSDSDCSRTDVFIKNDDAVVEDPNHHQKYLGKVNCRKVLEFEQKHQQQLQQRREEQQKRRQKEVNEQVKMKKLAERAVQQKYDFILMCGQNDFLNFI